MIFGVPHSRCWKGKTPTGLKTQFFDRPVVLNATWRGDTVKRSSQDSPSKSDFHQVAFLFHCSLQTPNSARMGAIRSCSQEQCSKPLLPLRWKGDGERCGRNAERYEARNGVEWSNAYHPRKLGAPAVEGEVQMPCHLRCQSLGNNVCKAQL